IQVSFLQQYTPTDFSGLVTKNHLAQLYMIEPQWASKLAMRIHEVNYGTDLDSFLERFDPLYMDTDDDFRWLLIGSEGKNVPLVEARIDGTAIVASDRAGENNTQFELVFPEAYFSETNLIVGEQNELYPILIKEGPFPEGNNWMYKCELLSGDNTLFVPFEELAAGKRFSKEWSPVEQTLSTKGGTPNYTSPFEMRNAFTMIRMEDMRPGNMISRPVAVSFRSNDGKVHSTWMQYADFQLDKQFREMKSRLLMYATSNKASDGTYKQKGKSGYEIQQGAGIKQQMEASNVAFYNTFDIRWLTQILLDLSIGKLGEGERRFVLRTGERGMVQFHEALSDYASLYTPLQDQNRVQSFGTNGLRFKGQFMEYMGPQGIVVTLMHDPMKDDLIRNKIMHPDGGPAESYVYDILDMGKNKDGNSNVRKVYVKNSNDIMGFEPGLRNPFTSDLKMNVMSSSVDGYKTHRASMCGAIVYDPTRTATVKPSILNI